MRLITRLLFFCVLFISSASHAQEWAPQGATWYHYYIYGLQGPDGYLKTTAENNDTTVQGHQCRVLHRTPGGSTFSWSTWIYTDSSKVFAYDDRSHEFYKVLDFDADTSESWIVTPKWDNRIDSILVRPVYKGQITINGKTVRRDSLSFQNIGHDKLINTEHPVLEAIEFIGFTITDFIPWRSGLDDGDYVGNLRCYTDDYMGNMNRTNQECETGINEKVNNISFKLFPNPASTSFTIQFQTQPKQFPDIKIYSMTGKECANVPLYTIGQSIFLSGFNPGLYLVQIGSHTEKLLIR